MVTGQLAKGKRQEAKGKAKGNKPWLVNKSTKDSPTHVSRLTTPHSRLIN